MVLTGHWYPAGSARRQGAELRLDEDGFQLFPDGELQHQNAGRELQSSPRIGNIPRKIRLPDGFLFTTLENDQVDAWLPRFGHKDGRRHWAHILESNWAWSGSRFYSPPLPGSSPLLGASKKIDFELPVEVIEVVSSGTLQTLDRLVFELNSLPASQQQSLRRRFQGLVPDDQEGFAYKLRFYEMPGWDDDTQIANAFALPSGDILVTDRLVEMAEKPEELDAILLHEIGHVVNRHGMRQVIQSSALTILLILVVGDVVAVEEWTLALPGFLPESNYSRGFESEADEYAFERMLAMDMDPAHFGRMLGRITGENGGIIEDGAVQDPGAKSWLEYLSSHPGTPNRIEQARRYSEIFRNR